MDDNACVLDERERRRLERRVVLHIDMDCFYVQVEQGLDPVRLRGRPCAVIQYTLIIAVGYEARRYGVKRNMHEAQARALCEHIVFARVPFENDKPNLNPYRDASSKVFTILTDHTSRVVERVSIDEAFLDVTAEVDAAVAAEAAATAAEEPTESSTTPPLPRNTVVWGDTVREDEEKDEGEGAGGGILPKKKNPERDEVEKRLILGATIAAGIRQRVNTELGYTCSAGVAQNKILAKLATGMNKPDGQTVLVPRHIAALWRETPVCALRSLGGKQGRYITEHLGVANMFDLRKHPLAWLVQRFGDRRGEWLHLIARGVARDPVRGSVLPQALGSSKEFPAGLSDPAQVSTWMMNFANELSDRSERDAAANDRRPASLVVHYVSKKGGTRAHGSKRVSYPLPVGVPDLSAAFLHKQAMLLYAKLGSPEPLRALGITLTGFSAAGSGNGGGGGSGAAAAAAGGGLGAWLNSGGSGGGAGTSAEACILLSSDDDDDGDGESGGGGGDDGDLGLALFPSDRSSDAVSLPDVIDVEEEEAVAAAPVPAQPQPRAAPAPGASNGLAAFGRKRRAAGVAGGDSGREQPAAPVPSASTRPAKTRRRTQADEPEVIDLC